MSSEMLTSSFMLQVIQTVSAMDKDDPKNGHYFLYSLLPEMVNNPNFTIKKNEGKYKFYLSNHILIHNILKYMKHLF